MLKHIGRQPQQQHQPGVHMRTPSNGSMLAGNEMGYTAASPISRPITRPINTSSLNSPTHSASPTAINQTKTTLTSNLDDSLAAFHQQHHHNGPLSSSLFERSLHQQQQQPQQVPNGHTSYLSSSGGLTLNNNKSVTLSNGGAHIRRGSHPGGLVGGTPASISGRLTAAARQVSSTTASVIGVREMLTSLGLLCVLSLFMALLGLIFLLKMTPPPDAIHFQDQVRIVGTPEEATNVYEVALALCSLGMTLDVCCCLVCATQLLLAARLISASACTTSNSSRERIKKFLSDSASTRICAIAGFFVSVPVFLTDIVLYTILQFPSTPAISTSIVISVGIVLCGCAMLHNLVVWQKHNKRSWFSGSSDQSPDDTRNSMHHLPSNVHHYSNMVLSPSHHQMPPATLDLSALNSNISGSLELSTLV